MPSPTPSEVAAALLAQREAFRAFVVARVGSAADADDILQNGLLKALGRSDELRDDAKLTAWFYRILRNVIVDHARSRGAARRRDDVWAADTAALAAADRDAHRQLCGCFASLLPALKPDHAALVQWVELEGKSVTAAALALGLTPNNASVKLHRARAELRARLIDFCGECSRGACLDCECDRPA